LDGYTLYIQSTEEFAMQTTVRKWGNSLGLRIPKSVADQLRVGHGTVVDVTVDGNDISVKPLGSGRVLLADLLDAVTPENLHDEIDSGAPAGREGW
jgi:antitoxin MazE